MSKDTDDQGQRTATLHSYHSPNHCKAWTSTRNFYTVRSVVVRSRGIYLKWHHLSATGSLLVIESGAFCVPVASSSYLKCHNLLPDRSSISYLEWLQLCAKGEHKIEAQDRVSIVSIPTTCLSNATSNDIKFDISYSYLSIQNAINNGIPR